MRDFSDAYFFRLSSSEANLELFVSLGVVGSSKLIFFVSLGVAGWRFIFF